MDSSEFKLLHGNPTLIVTFGGFLMKFGGIQPFEFFNFLTNNFPDTDKLFYIDKKCNHYHKGIEGISKDVPETVEYLKSKIKGYRQVIFMGLSAGGYASILFGSLLNVTNVIAFIPQTILHKEDKDPRYKNLLKFINNTTVYSIYGDPYGDEIHNLSHCENINVFPNVKVYKKEHLDIKKLRDSGELKEIINFVFQKNHQQLLQEQL